MTVEIGTRRSGSPAETAAESGEDAYDADACRESRAPRHERGRRRVDAILDAASALLAEGGIANLTIDAVAKRSGTSKSSMYHFFPDRDHVVQALAERHRARICDRDLLRLEDPVDWAGLTLEQVVARYLQPFRSYLDEHPDLLQIMSAGCHTARAAARAAGLRALHLEQAERVVAARTPHAAPAERRARALAMFAVVKGTIDVSTWMTPEDRAVLLRELEVVLVAYLGAAERGAATSHPPPSAR